MTKNADLTNTSTILKLTGSLSHEAYNGANSDTKLLLASF